MADYQKVEISQDNSPEVSESEQETVRNLMEEARQQEEDLNRRAGLEEEIPESVEVSERPEWLPEKFENPEAMAKAYQALEAAMSKSEPQEGGGLEPLKSEDFESFTRELQETGDVSEESKQQLVDWGLPKEIVDAHVEGLQARIQLEVQSVQSEVGGPEAYEQMIEWATQNLDEGDQQMFDQAVTNGSKEQMLFAVRSFKALSQHSGGANPGILQGSTSNDGAYGGFRSLAELTTAMKDPRYSKDKAYRNDVETKLSNSDIL